MKTGHDLKRAARPLRGAGLELEGQAFDTMLAAWLLNPSRASYELGDLALDYLDTRPPPPPASPARKAPPSRSSRRPRSPPTRARRRTPSSACAP